jgi:hypothetical protein
MDSSSEGVAATRSTDAVAGAPLARWEGSPTTDAPLPTPISSSSDSSRPPRLTVSRNCQLKETEYGPCAQHRCHAVPHRVHRQQQHREKNASLISVHRRSSKLGSTCTSSSSLARCAPCVVSGYSSWSRRVPAVRYGRWGRKNKPPGPMVRGRVTVPSSKGHRPASTRSRDDLPEVQQQDSR